MQTIKDLLNKIKWDKKENPEDHVVVYEDRVEGKERKIPFESIKKVEEGFMIVEKGGERTNIPLHRIRKVLKKGKLIWQRKR